MLVLFANSCRDIYFFFKFPFFANAEPASLIKRSDFSVGNGSLFFGPLVVQVISLSPASIWTAKRHRKKTINFFIVTPIGDDERTHEVYTF